MVDVGVSEWLVMLTIKVNFSVKLKTQVELITGSKRHLYKGFWKLAYNILE